MKHFMLMIYCIPLGIAFTNLLDDIEIIMEDGTFNNLNYDNVIIPTLVFLVTLLADEVIKLHKEVEELKKGKTDFNQ